MIPAFSAFTFKAAASTPLTVIVSKKNLFCCDSPMAFKPLATATAILCTRVAIFFKPLGPWYTAYIAAMLASNACAVQILEVAFSLLICCSLVCSAIRSARLPCASMLTPIKRPGIPLLKSSLVAKKAACGPPNPMGTPKRCALPSAMSAPSSPGGVSRVSASKSVATITRPSTACTLSIKAR